MSSKPINLQQHFLCGILKTAPSFIYHQTSINEEVDTKEKDSMEDKPLHLNTHNTLTLNTFATLKGTCIHKPNGSLTSVTEEHYKTFLKEEQEEENDREDESKRRNPL